MKYQNGVITESLRMSSSMHNEHLQHSLHHQMNRIRRFIQIKLVQFWKYLRILLISSILSFSILPMRAVDASSSSSDVSSSYYLQNNLHQRPLQQMQPHQKPQQSDKPIQTQPSQPYYNPSSSRNSNTVRSRRQYPRSTRYIQQNRNKPTATTVTQKQRVKRTTLLIMLLTLAASSFRASIRKSKVVRNVTPFGVIRNISPLGNGVSVIRVCMALEFTNDDNGDKEAKCLLNKLYLEEKDLLAKISSSSSFLSQASGQELQLKGAYSFRQQALMDFCCSVGKTLLQYTKYMRYGIVESIRVPFVEEAVKEFRRVAKEERQVFATATANRTNPRNAPEASEKKHEERQHPQSGYILATILLSIKGDKTTVPLPFGIIRQRDIARSLSRIVSDVKVDDCLVGAEIMWMPKKNTQRKNSSVDGVASDNDDVVLLSEKDVLTSFPELVPLT
ncbi:hypothetical protein ACHAWC_004922 [Mediolabrus comicus]